MTSECLSASRFTEDKYNFFASIKTPQAAAIRASVHHKYPFLSQNRQTIEQEFNQLFMVLKEQRFNHPAFWLYCYYCSEMLRNCYLIYNKPNLVEKYKKYSEEILYRINHDNKEPQVAEETYLAAFQKQLAADLGQLASTPKHIAKIRDWVAFSNLYRIHLVFCRLSVMQGIAVAKELQWLDSLGKIIGRQLNADKMLAVLKAPTPIFYGLSVGFFAARFVMNAAMLLKHTFSPSEGEKQLETRQRFIMELKKRHCDFLNDIVWGTVNGLTNYSQFFNISAPVANSMLSVFLCFDVALLLYRRHLANVDYCAKREEYLQDLERYRFLLLSLDSSLNETERETYQNQCTIIKQQLEQLEISWHASSATYLFNVAAAAIMVGGYSASLLLAAFPPAVFACYLISTIAVAMYLTADTFGKYREASLRLEKAEQQGVVSAATRLQAESARSEFIWTMVKNAVIPLFLVTTFAVCWPAAVALTAIYIGYECVKGYGPAKKLPEPPAVEANHSSSFLAISASA